MGDVINLKRARKQKARREADAEAASNRAMYGRTKAEKARDEKTAKLLSNRIDQSKLDKE